MSNVNSDDPGPRPPDPVEGDIGGSYRTDETAGTQASGREGWPVLGVIVVAIVLLIPVVWIVVSVGRMVKVLGQGPASWLYAAVLVLIVAVVVWLLFRMLGSARSNNP